MFYSVNMNTQLGNSQITMDEYIMKGPSAKRIRDSSKSNYAMSNSSELGNDLFMPTERDRLRKLFPLLDSDVILFINNLF